MARKRPSPAPGPVDAPGTGQPESNAHRPREWRLAAIAPLALLLVVAVAYATSHTEFGVDTWVSLAGGRYILAHGVTTADPFAFDSRRPEPLPADAGFPARLEAWLLPTGWINQNWLTHVFFAVVAGRFGLDALVLWKVLTCLLVALVLVATARRRHAAPALAFLLPAAALLAGRQFFEIRAQEATNLLAVTLMLLLTLAALRPSRTLWLAVPLFALWGNIHGGFVWGLLALAVFCAASVVAAWIGHGFVMVEGRVLRRVAAVLAASLVATVALSPYRLANLTHPLLISFSADAGMWRSVWEWRPLVDGTAAERWTFIAAVLVALVGAIIALREGAAAVAPPRAAPPDPTRALDLGSAAVLAMTATMAVTSRRFLPMTYLVAAPLLAQWLTQAWRRYAPRRAAPVVPEAATLLVLRPRGAALALCWLVAVGLAAAVFAPLARTLFGPWPLDDRRVSVADRMLQTVGQPWDACRFVSLNRVHGRLWNFWSSGGFWEWCQSGDPTPVTIPLQVSIDGRAQAAYGVETARWYNMLDIGGPAALRAEREGREPTADEVAAIRPWVATQLGDAQVWIAHVGQRDEDSQLARALFNLPNWEVVYADAHDTLLADATTAQGRALSAAVDGGAARFPDAASELLTRAYRSLRYVGPENAAQALALARKAYAARPSQRAVTLATAAALDPATQAEAATFTAAIVGQLESDREVILRHHGSYERLVAAVTAARFLEQVAATRGDAAGRDRAAERLASLAQEANRLVGESEW